MFGFFKRRKAEQQAAENLRRGQEEAQKLADSFTTLDQLKRNAEIARQKHLDEISKSVSLVPGSEKYRLEQQQTNANIRTLNITEFSKIAGSRYVAFDLETTGLNSLSDEIVEIGAVLVENGQIIREYSQLVNPGRSMPPDASAVNHITDDMLVHQPQIHQVLPAFLSFVGDDVLAAHNASFDLKFIAQACMREQFRIPVGFFDTMSLARYWPEAEDKKLVSLCDVAGVETVPSHRALDDARAVVGLISASMKRRADSKKKS